MINVNNGIIQNFNNLLKTNPLAENVKIYNMADTSYTENPESIKPKQVLIQNVTSDSINLQDIRQIVAPLNTLKSGMYVDILSKNQIWLITSLPDNNKIYEKAILEYCNYNLKWQDADGNIFEYPCNIESNANLGETQNRYLTIGTSQLSIKLPYDDNTIKLDDGKRFLIDKNYDEPTAFKVTKVNPINKNYQNLGIIEVTVEEDQFNSNTDNKELMIADYIDKTPEPGEPEIINCEIVPSVNTIKAGGKPVTFTANFIDADGNIIQDKNIKPIWDVVIANNKEQYFIVNVVDDTLSITADKSTKDVPFNILITVKGQVDGEIAEDINAELMIMVTGLFG